MRGRSGDERSASPDRPPICTRNRAPALAPPGPDERPLELALLDAAGTGHGAEHCYACGHRLRPRDPAPYCTGCRDGQLAPDVDPYDPPEPLR